MMTDPAVDAAKRAVGDRHWWLTRLDDAMVAQVCDYAEAAAREALKPIRELYEQLCRVHKGRVHTDSIHIMGVLNLFEPLLFAAEEVDRG